MIRSEVWRLLAQWPLFVEIYKSVISEKRQLRLVVRITRDLVVRRAVKEVTSYLTTLTNFPNFLSMEWFGFLAHGVSITSYLLSKWLHAYYLSTKRGFILLTWASECLREKNSLVICKWSCGFVFAWHCWDRLQEGMQLKSNFKYFLRSKYNIHRSININTRSKSNMHRYINIMASRRNYALI